MEIRPLALAGRVFAGEEGRVARSGPRCFPTLGLLAAIGFLGCQGEGPAGPTRTGCDVSYPAQASSPYVLPFRVGETYVVGQANCSDGSHARGTSVQFGYDFLMPIGTPVVASREGTVLLVEERFTDANRRPGQENYINIVHDDETIAGYVHLTQNGALVDIGETVRRGQVIGLSGDTGSSTEPHLHFHVQACEGCGTIPVTFLNTRPHANGLQQAEAYTAGVY